MARNCAVHNANMNGLRVDAPVRDFSVSLSDQLGSIANIERSGGLEVRAWSEILKRRGGECRPDDAVLVVQCQCARCWTGNNGGEVVVMETLTGDVRGSLIAGYLVVG